MNKYYYPLLIILLSAHLSFAQDSLEISAEIRPRIIIENGYKNPNSTSENPLVYTTQRSRLNIGFKKNSYQAFLSIQNVAIWGDDNLFNSSSSLGNTNSFLLHQAWVDWSIHSKWSLKTGRQPFSYDDQRILSARNWNDYQVCYDAVLLKRRAQKTSLDIACSWNSDSKTSEFYPSSKLRLLNFVRFEYRKNHLNVSSIAILTGKTFSDSNSTIELTSTIGLNLGLANPYWKVVSSMYFQSRINHFSQPQNALLFSVKIQRFLFNQKGKLELVYEYISGESEKQPNPKWARFDLLYGRRHGYYGYMDYFSSTPDQGLQDICLKTEYTIHKKILASLHYHYFNLSVDKRKPLNSNEFVSKELGHELDFTLKCRLNKTTSLQAGYSCYFVSETLKIIKSIQPERISFPQFAYVMISFKPVLIINSFAMDSVAI
jgi:hypothetical protein